MQDAQPSPNAEQRLNRLNGHRDVLDDAAQEDESKHLQGLLDWSDNHRIVFYCLGGIFLGFQVGPEMDGLVAWTIAWFEKRGGGDCGSLHQALHATRHPAVAAIPLAQRVTAISLLRQLTSRWPV